MSLCDTLVGGPETTQFKMFNLLPEDNVLMQNSPNSHPNSQ